MTAAMYFSDGSLATLSLPADVTNPDEFVLYLRENPIMLIAGTYYFTDKIVRFTLG